MADHDTLRLYGWGDAARLRVIPGSGVNLSHFFPRPDTDGHSSEDKSASQLIVLLASRLLREKGILAFIQAAKHLKLSGINACFWVAGDPDVGNPGSVSEDELQTWKTERVVEFLEHRHDMPELLRQVDIAVLPSSYCEGVPKFLIEAAATGLPLVASDIPGCRMIVRPEVNGFLVPTHDVAALFGALESLLTDTALRARFGRASRQIAVEEFSEDKIIGQYLALYRQLGIPA